MCCLLAHARISMADCTVYAAENDGASPAVELAGMVRRLVPTLRLEAACAQRTALTERVGCCNLDCKVVDRKAGKGEAEVPLLKCSQCDVVAYCCRACQKVSWAEHRSVCTILMQDRLKGI